MNIGALKQRYIQIVFIGAAVALVAQAAYLQLINETYRQRAERTTVEKLTVYPPRGLVYDRKGRLIVNNEAMFDLMVIYNQVDFNNINIKKFCRLVGIDEAGFWSRLDKDFKSGRFSRSVPFVFEKKLSIEQYARLQECLYEFSGFFVQPRNIRGYPYNAGAHVLGYINEVDPRDIERFKDKETGISKYESGDYIGAAGLESQYEDDLKGKKGYSLLLKNNLGRIVGKYAGGNFDSTAVPGRDLISSIDIDLQQYGEFLMQNKTGSVVAIEPRTGQVLCMLSAPYYNPNRLAMTQERGKIFSELLNDTLKPFFDRTVMAKYPPGSIFKTVVSLVGMQEGTLNPNRGMSCGGGYFYAGRLYKCHGHGHIGNVVDALAYSCNTYYFNEFRNEIDKFGFSNSDKGLDMFVDYCRQMGLGVKLGIDYPNENGGNVPTTAYYDKIYPKKLGGWRSPTIMSVGIGQGELQLTTLQMANLAACIANGGHWYTPHLAKEFKDGPIPKKYVERHDVNIDKQWFKLVQEGMAECVNRGTARIAQVPGIQVCGKTGTSQNPHGKDHSVFYAFAPKENPKIAIAVYVENAGWGASYAAPIAGLMIEKYLNDTIATARLPVQDRMVRADLIGRGNADKIQAQAPKKPETPETPTDMPDRSPALGVNTGDGQRRR
ncbi:MAG: penicillin-binding protein 2 [Saprospiraceae bacterium]|nr:penicillin-binding protein 2 [Saprospiraceae bacterium]